MSRAVLNPYRTFSKEAIKARASVPLQADMVFVENTVEASVDLYQIRDALGIADVDFHGQANSAAVNRWSGFGPFERSYSNPYNWDSVLQQAVSLPDGLFEFAGYNHNAIAPGGFSAPSTAYANQGGRASIHGVCNIGEIDYPGAAGIAFVITDSYGTIIAWEVTDINNYADVVDRVVTTNGNLDFSLSGAKAAFYILSVSSVMDEGDIISNLLCIVPNTTVQVFDIVVLLPTKIYFNGQEYNGGTHTVGNWTAYGITLDMGTGVVTIGDIFNGGGNIGTATVTIGMSKQIGEQVDDAVTVYQGSFPATFNLSDLIFPIPGADFSNCGPFGYACSISVVGF